MTVDHDYPRWTPDSSTIVYFTPAEKEGEAGRLWEIPALGGTAPRNLARATTGADVSHDGLRVATFQKVADRRLTDDPRPQWSAGRDGHSGSGARVFHAPLVAGRSLGGVHCQ